MCLIEFLNIYALICIMVLCDAGKASVNILTEI